MRQHQKGFTLIEVILVLGITGFIIATIAMTTTTLLRNSEQPNTQQILLKEVKSAGYWLPRDILMSNDITLGDPNGFPFTINIPVDQDVNNDYSIEYLFDGNSLLRKQYDSLDVLVAENLITRYIDTGNTFFESTSDTMYKLTLQVSLAEEVITVSYEARRRLIVD